MVKAARKRKDKNDRSSTTHVRPLLEGYSPAVVAAASQWVEQYRDPKRYPRPCAVTDVLIGDGEVPALYGACRVSGGVVVAALQERVCAGCRRRPWGGAMCPARHDGVCAHTDPCRSTPLLFWLFCAAQSARAKAEFPEETEELYFAVSQARYLQNPLMELTYMWAMTGQVRLARPPLPPAPACCRYLPPPPVLLLAAQQPLAQATSVECRNAENASKCGCSCCACRSCECRVAAA
jgi:hypothetical protein